MNLIIRYYNLNRRILFRPTAAHLECVALN